MNPMAAKLKHGSLQDAEHYPVCEGIRGTTPLGLPLSHRRSDTLRAQVRDHDLDGCLSASLMPLLMRRREPFIVFTCVVMISSVRVKTCTHATM